MTEKITGVVYILSLAGESERQVGVKIGESAIIEGEFGSLIIDASLQPPKVQGKGNIVIRDGDRLVRTKRMNLGERLEIALISNAPAGEIIYTDDGA